MKPIHRVSGEAHSKRLGNAKKVIVTMVGRGLFVLAILACFFAGGEACAQGPAESDNFVVLREPRFQLPAQVQPYELPLLKEIELYVSRDRGQNWRQCGVAQPNAGMFTFDAPSDGEYWFTLRTVYKDGKRLPERLEGAPPMKRVLVDSTPPKLRVQGSRLAGGQIGVEWAVQDSDADLSTLTLEYAINGSASWTPAPLPASTANGRMTFAPAAAGAVDLRLRVRDRAGNWGTDQVSLGVPRGVPAMSGARPQPAAQPSSSPGWEDEFRTPPPPSLGSRMAPAFGDPEPNPSFAPRSRPAPTDPRRPATADAPPLWNDRSEPRRPSINPLLVNSMHFAINYSLEDVGKSGVRAISLYYTEDGRAWEFYGDDDDGASPFLVGVKGEGLYGFKLIATSGVGVGEEPPANGEAPQVWIEVDTSPPTIDLPPPEVKRGATQHSLIIRWSVQDRNLDARPITIKYGETATGPWTEIVNRFENRGNYPWTIPKDAPYKFFIRLEAIDRAGNSANAESEEIVVDFSRPRLRVLGVEPDRDARPITREPREPRQPALPPTTDSAPTEEPPTP